MLKPLTTEFLAEVKFILGNLSDIWTLAQAETIRQGIVSYIGYFNCNGNRLNQYAVNMESFDPLSLILRNFYIFENCGNILSLEFRHSGLWLKLIYLANISRSKVFYTFCFLLLNEIDFSVLYFYQYITIGFYQVPITFASSVKD